MELEKTEKRIEGEKEKEPEQEIAPELVRTIEEADFMIDDKVNILLTKAGLKPSSEIILDITCDDGKKTAEFLDEDDIQRHLWIIKELGMPAIVGERKIENQDCSAPNGPKKVWKWNRIHVLIGRTQEDLDFLVKALASNNDALIGQAFGFPPTAVDAYCGKSKRFDVKNIKKLPKKVRESEAVLFSSPTLSADNWQEEIKQGQSWADFIKKTSPVIYKEAIKTMKTRYE